MPRNEYCYATTNTFTPATDAPKFWRVHVSGDLVDLTPVRPEMIDGQLVNVQLCPTKAAATVGVFNTTSANSTAGRKPSLDDYDR